MKNVKMVPAICTQCGGKIEVDNSKDAAICPYCGTAFVVEKAINKYKTEYHIEHADIYIKGKGPSIANVIKNYHDNKHREKMAKLEAAAEEERRLREREEYERTPQGRAEYMIGLILMTGILLLAMGLLTYLTFTLPR